MLRHAPAQGAGSRPDLPALLQLLKPVTWFPPMWAFACGAVSAGVPLSQQPWLVVAGMLLAGPLVCGASQVVNDWYDREVDAINEPQRPIPSGRVPGDWGFYFAVSWSLLALFFGVALGPVVGIATLLGLALAWAYSAPPLRLKLNGWWGNLAVGISYEGLAWVTGAAVLLGSLPDWRILSLAALYSLGAHGIMTLNDFKAIEGDRALGIRTLPVQLGPRLAARLACVVMILPQLLVISLLLGWGLAPYAWLVGGLVILQLLAMLRMLRDPARFAPWYNGTGVMLYVSGMMASAAAIGRLPGVVAP